MKNLIIFRLKIGIHGLLNISQYNYLNLAFSVDSGGSSSSLMAFPRVGRSSLMAFPRVGRRSNQDFVGCAKGNSNRLRLLYGQKRAGQSSLIPFPRVGKRSDPNWMTKLKAMSLGIFRTVRDAHKILSVINC